jgi:alcohol dehydrogenase
MKVSQISQTAVPLVAVNTTAGTASEMTIFSIITDEERHIKMALVDKHMTPILAVNDPDLNG